MRKALYSLLILATSLTACDKEEINESEPAAEATMTRTLDFTIRGTAKDTTYSTELIKATARFGDDAPLFGSEKNVFLMTIDAGPHGDETKAGDVVQFVIDPAALRADYVGVYQIEAPADLPVKQIHYAYVSNHTAGSYSAKLVGTNMGVPMTGKLNITRYDPAKNTISGTYTMSTKLNYDPTKFSYGWELDEVCTLAVSGTFSNVKIKQD